MKNKKNSINEENINNNYCTKCGNKIEKNDNFCSNCGKAFNDEKVNSLDDLAKKASETVEKVLDTEDNTKEFSKSDISNNRAMAIIAYFSPLALLPYLGQKNSKYAQFHAINGMNLFIWEIALYLIYSITETIFDSFKYTSSSNISDILLNASTSSIPWFISLPLSIISFILVSLSIFGIVYAACGKAKELPIISKLKIIKK